MVKGKKNYTDQAINGLALMGSMTVVNYIIQLITTFYLARLLTPEEHGEMAAILIPIGLAELFWMMGVGPAIVQKKDLTKVDISTGHTLNIIFGLIIVVITNLFAPIWAFLFNIENSLMIRIFSIVFILHSISGVSQSLSQKKLKYRRISLIRSFELIIYGIVAIALAFMNLGVWSLVYATIIKFLINAVSFLILEPVGFHLNINKQSAKSLMYFGGGFTLAKVFNYIANNGDNYVVGKTLGKGELGLGSYSKAYQLLMYPVKLIGDTIDQVMFPLLAKIQTDTKKLTNFFLGGLGLVLLVSFPVSIVAFFRAADIVSFFLGDQWGYVVEPFRIMVAALFFRIAYKVGDSLIRATGKVYKRSLIQLIYAVIVVVGAIIGSGFGLEGVAIGTVIAFTSNFFLIIMLCMKILKLQVKVAIRYLLSIMVIPIPTIILALIYEQIVIIENPFLSCVIFTLWITCVYVISYILFHKRILNKEFVIFYNNIFNKIIGKLKRVRN